MGKHAKLSPSGSHTWMSCAGAIPLAEKFEKRSSSSVYARIGTAIHEVCEQCLSKNEDPYDYVGKTIVVEDDPIDITREHADMANTFVEYVRRQEGEKFYEQKVSVEVIDDCWGTADAVILNQDTKTLEIADLKTGAGVQVDAKDNSQLRCYALGALNLFRDIYDIETVKATIVQPAFAYLKDRPEGVSTDEMSVMELDEFGKKLVKSVNRMEKARDKLDDPDTYTPSDKACKFCAAKTVCPALQREAEEVAKQDFSEYKDGPSEDLSYWMDKVPVVKLFCDAVRDEVATRLKSGEDVPGYKLIAGRSTRLWADEEALVETLKKRRFTKAQYMEPMALMSVAKLEKELKGVFDVNPHVFVKPGKPAVAKADNPKPKWEPENGAQADFKDFKE